jgi:hypothetical protein
VRLTHRHHPATALSPCILSASGLSSASASTPSGTGTWLLAAFSPALLMSLVLGLPAVAGSHPPSGAMVMVR